MSKEKQIIKKKEVKKKNSLHSSKKYKSIRHLLEVLFSKNKNLTREEAYKHVKKEFPNSKYAGHDHFSWYRTHIQRRGDFIAIKPPKWANSIKNMLHKKGDSNVQEQRKERKEI